MMAIEYLNVLPGLIFDEESDVLKGRYCSKDRGLVSDSRCGRDFYL